MSELEPVGAIGVYEERCVGAGNCADVAPEHFSQRDEDGIVIVLDVAVGAADREVVEQAIDICPVAALFLTPNP